MDKHTLAAFQLAESDEQQKYSPLRRYLQDMRDLRARLERLKDEETQEADSTGEGQS